MIRRVDGGRPRFTNEAIGPAHARVPSPRADDFFDTPSLFTSVAWNIARVGPRDRSSEPTSVEQTEARKDPPIRVSKTASVGPSLDASEMPQIAPGQL